METISVAFAGTVGSIIFFGGIALLMWVDQRGKLRQRDLDHAERMKALEVGQPLPDADVARAKADSTRAAVAGVIGVFVPLFMAAAATVTTCVTIAQANVPWERSSTSLLIVVWIVSGLISLVTVVLSLIAVRRRGTTTEHDKMVSEQPRPTSNHLAGSREPTTSFVASE
jgi:hypothetical protein